MFVKFIDDFNEAVNFKNSEKVKIQTLSDKLTDKKTRGLIIRNDGDENSINYFAAELRPIYNDFTQEIFDSILVRIREDNKEINFKKSFDSAKDAIKEFRNLRKIFSNKEKVLKFLISYKYEKSVKNIF